MSSSTRPTTFVVDVCGTLVQDDTTLGLLRCHFDRCEEGWFRAVVLGMLTARGSPLRWAFVVLEKATGRHWLKHLLVRLLAGDQASALDESGRAYVQVLLTRRRVQPVWDRLSQVGRPDHIILASASLEPVVRALAEVMGARYVSSTLEVRNGVLTGRYVEDLTGQKESAIVRKYGEDALASPFAAFSDNLSDRPLLAKAGYACVVLHRESHRARWANLSADYVRVAD